MSFFNYNSSKIKWANAIFTCALYFSNWRDKTKIKQNCKSDTSLYEYHASLNHPLRGVTRACKNTTLA